MVEFEQTLERMAIIAELEEARDHFARAAELLQGQGMVKRADTARDLAQGAAGMRSLLSLDWHDADQAAA